MNFNKPIYSVLYSVGFWSNSENLDGTAALKIKDSNGNWTQMTNLLSLQLNARGQGLKRYILIIFLTEFMGSNLNALPQQPAVETWEDCQLMILFLV